jgi:hypothetical protein
VARRIVAFLDVLGFSSLVHNVPHPELVRIYRSLQQAAHAQTTTPVFPDDHRRWDSDAYYADDEIQRRRTANVVIASDSIIVYSHDLDRPADIPDEPDGIQAMQDAGGVLAAVRGLLVAGFRQGVALRGGIAIGELDELSLDQETINPEGWTSRFDGIVGLGLVSAYELEGRCNWSGAILSADFGGWLELVALGEHDDGTFTLLDSFIASQLVVCTRVPVKVRDEDGQPAISCESAWAVNWPLFAGHVDWRLGEDEVERAFTSFDRPADAQTEAKRDATIAFMRRAEADSKATLSQRFSGASPGDAATG